MVWHSLVSSLSAAHSPMIDRLTGDYWQELSDTDEEFLRKWRKSKEIRLFNIPIQYESNVVSLFQCSERVERFLLDVNNVAKVESICSDFLLNVDNKFSRRQSIVRMNGTILGLNYSRKSRYPIWEWTTKKSKHKTLSTLMMNQSVCSLFSSSISKMIRWIIC